MLRLAIGILVLAISVPAPVARGAAVVPASSNLQFIQISRDHRHFVLAGSKRPFTPWGFNYDHDRSGRLLEEYWQSDWPTVCEDFQEMKTLGANVVRIHLQVANFMQSELQPNRDALAQLAKLVTLAEQTGLYLDVTGLGCYKKSDVPHWYNELDETRRWEVQARFWEAVAQVCRSSPAVFCYDLMNEPVVTEDKSDDWTPGAFADRYYVQRLVLKFSGRTPAQIARAWVDKLAGAIRKEDRRHLITVGAIPWALTWPGVKPLFYSKTVGKQLDFVSLHFYPKQGEVQQALQALQVYCVGKPIVIEEMFPLSCSIEELDQFINSSRKVACGWMGFYWGKTIEEYRQSTLDKGESMTLGWLEYFKKKSPSILGLSAARP